MRVISIVVAAFVFLGVAPARAQSDQQDRPAVILYAAVSADGATMHVSGADFPDEPFVTLGGFLLGGVAVVSTPDVDRLTALMPALAPGNYRLTLSDQLPIGDARDTGTLVNFDVTIGIAGTARGSASDCGGECSPEPPRAD